MDTQGRAANAGYIQQIVVYVSIGVQEDLRVCPPGLSPWAGCLFVPTQNRVDCGPFGLPREFSSFVSWLVPRRFAGVPLLSVLQDGRREVLPVC